MSIDKEDATEVEKFIAGLSDDDMKLLFMEELDLLESDFQSLYGDDFGDAINAQAWGGMSWGRSNSWDWITDRIAVGSDDHMHPKTAAGAAAIAKMREDGITHILDARAEAMSSRYGGVAPEGFVYLNNGTGDDGRRKSVNYFRKTIDFALSALEDPNAKILFHCAAGINRGPSAAFAVMRMLGYGSQEAFDLMKSKRPCVWVAYRKDADRAVRVIKSEARNRQRREQEGR